MIVGLGIDVVDIRRFAAALERTPRMAERLFTESERNLPARSLAARFAAKEAVAKALGAPPGLHWHDAEVLTEPSGRPVLRTTGTVHAAASALGVVTWHLSLTHDGGLAAAVAVAEARPT